MTEFIRVPFVIEKDGPPPPKRVPPPPRPKAFYALNDLKPGGPPARIPRAASTLRGAVANYQKTPEGRGTRFCVRALTPRMCRVWRLK